MGKDKYSIYQDENSLEERALSFLRENFKENKFLYNLDLLKGKIEEINYLLKKHYILERGETVSSFCYQLDKKGERIILGL